jgi:phosphomethylpyrimidine synthase
MKGAFMSRPMTSPDRSWTLPPLGNQPSTDPRVTTPGSFANPNRVGTPYAFSSPDTPGMPPVSDLTAMDFARPQDRQCKTQLETRFI